MRGATELLRRKPPYRVISTHAPRAGRDRRKTATGCSASNFNPRAPCGARHGSFFQAIARIKFQPTRPVRGATVCFLLNSGDCLISTHAPRAGRDGEELEEFAPHFKFQPTRPVRGATLPRPLSSSAHRHFNPRAPCGARPMANAPMPGPFGFQPTRPVRGATGRAVPYRVRRAAISTHAPRAGRDRNGAVTPRRASEFQPTRPVRGATFSLSIVSGLT